jgi:hypothetical protein
MALCKYNPNNVLFSLFCLFAFVSLYPSVPSESDIPALSSHVRIRAHADPKSDQTIKNLHLTHPPHLVPG